MLKLLLASNRIEFRVSSHSDPETMLPSNYITSSVETKLIARN